MTAVRAGIAALALSTVLPVVAEAAPARHPMRHETIRAAQGSSGTTAPKNAFREEFLTDLEEVQRKLMALANAVPADRYTWRPTDGVRSIGEVNMHIAGSNYFLPSFIGAKPPAGLSTEMEKIGGKQRILEELQKSFDHLRAAAAATPDAEFEKSVKLFNRHTTYRGVYVTILNHLHEHLGQLIAYARMAGVVPPWSRNEG